MSMWRAAVPVFACAAVGALAGSHNCTGQPGEACGLSDADPLLQQSVKRLSGFDVYVSTAETIEDIMYWAVLYKSMKPYYPSHSHWLLISKESELNKRAHAIRMAIAQNFWHAQVDVFDPQALNLESVTPAMFRQLGVFQYSPDQYRRVVNIDADSLVFANIDHMTHRIPHMILAREQGDCRNLTQTLLSEQPATNLMSMVPDKAVVNLLTTATLRLYASNDSRRENVSHANLISRAYSRVHPEREQGSFHPTEVVSATCLMHHRDQVLSRRARAGAGRSQPQGVLGGSGSPDPMPRTATVSASKARAGGQAKATVHSQRVSAATAERSSPQPLTAAAGVPSAAACQLLEVAQGLRKVRAGLQELHAHLRDEGACADAGIAWHAETATSLVASAQSQLFTLAAELNKRRGRGPQVRRGSASAEEATEHLGTQAQRETTRATSTTTAARQSSTSMEPCWVQLRDQTPAEAAGDERLQAGLEAPPRAGARRSHGGTPPSAATGVGRSHAPAGGEAPAAAGGSSWDSWPSLGTEEHSSPSLSSPSRASAVRPKAGAIGGEETATTASPRTTAAGSSAGSEDCGLAQAAAVRLASHLEACRPPSGGARVTGSPQSCPSRLGVEDEFDSFFANPLPPGLHGLLSAAAPVIQDPGAEPSRPPPATPPRPGLPLPRVSEDFSVQRFRYIDAPSQDVQRALELAARVMSSSVADGR